MRYNLLLLAVVLVLVLVVGIPSYLTDFHEGRTQFWYDTLLWVFVVDRTPQGANEGGSISLTFPDHYCYKHIGGYTGQLDFSFYHVPGDTNFVVKLYSGEWWGSGNCDVPEFVWSTGLLERNK